ncbi:MAG: site-specific DNA-methyltransferase [Chlorobium sp.]|nr:MAG: site-specific DNA-methyltransferase [Chlorobium sp.]
MHSPNLTDGNIDRIRELFPACVTEAHDEHGTLKLAVDFDQLKQELSDSIVEGPQERYHLNWPGKREALLTANAPIAKTLRPCREESVDFDTTKNLFIEGDNLDALKLLQETYLGKVKMIYIDPPYNTGNDFIYEDDFAENTDEFLLRSNQKDEEGNRLTANTESNGRFHSDWLSMIYPRLKLARNLLRDDGVIFISIDDGEVAQLRKMCDEVFGEGNFLAQLVWERAFSPKNDAKYISNSHDYVVMFAKSILDFSIGRLERTEEANSRYANPDNDPRGLWSSSDISVKTYAAANDFSINTPSGKIIEPPAGRCWRLSKKAFLERLEDNRIWFGPNGDNVPRIKRFLSEIREGMTPTSLLFYKDVGHSQEGSQEVKKLLEDQGVFDGPKPVRLLRRLLSLANTDRDTIILDFFAGSATTAHAVMQLNADDGGNRKFIMVQLPEPCNEQSEAFKAGYKTIAEISKERIRRAGKKIKDEKEQTATGQGVLQYAPTHLDTGFRVLKVDSSNMAEVYYTPDAVKQEELFNAVDNIKPDRTPEDLLFQILLDLSVDLSLPIHKELIQGKSLFFVNQPPYDLIACFDTGVSEELVKELAQHKPLRVVFRDTGFTTDTVKINVDQIFKQLSPGTEVKSI